VLDDAFTTNNELRVEKRAVNELLLRLSEDLPNRRCCYTVLTPFLHCSYTVVTLLLHYCYTLSPDTLHQRCLVLDGPSCMTVQTLLGGGRKAHQVHTHIHTHTHTHTRAHAHTHTHTHTQIVVPNNSLSSYHRIREQRLCWPHYGSVRSYLDTVRHLPAAREPFLGPLLSLPDSPEGALGDGEGEGRERCEGVEREGGKAGAEDVTSEELEGFGLVYLDYCCRLSTGAFSLEKSPTQDIKALFRLGYFILFSLYFHIPACPIACPIAYPVGSYQVT
jgi:hypothetical protein